MYQLVDYIDGYARCTIPSISQILLERDSILVLLMWRSYLRGKDVGKVTLGEFFSPSGRKLVAPFPPTGFSLLLAPYGTKIIRRQRASPITLTATADQQHSFVSRLFPILLQLQGGTYKAVGHQHLFSPSWHRPETAKAAQMIP